MATRSLVEIVREMESLTGHDAEVDHGRADDLLVEAISWLSAGEPPDVESSANRLTEAWKRLPKWGA